MSRSELLLQNIARTTIESLDPRQLLAFTADVNFQPWWTRGRQVDPIADIGFPFQENGSLGYGWNHWKANNMVQRDPRVSSDAALSTYVEFNGSAGEEDEWEMTVPNGSYSVTLTAGDTQAINSTYAFDLEGESALRGRPTWRQRFVTSTVTIQVSDGRLTLTAGEGASNNKLNALHIEKLDATPPAAPTNLSARLTSTSTVDLTWAAVDSGIDGYVVQQSEDGSNWREIAYRGPTTTRFVVTGLDTSVAHQFRVFAYNADGWSGASNTARVTAVVTPTPDPDPTPGSDYFDGVTVNPEYDPYAVAAGLRSLGVNAVRIWGDIEWTRFATRNWMDAARAYHNLGFHVTLLITDEKVPTYDQARAYFNYAVSLPGMTQAVDRWEIINEPNFGKYWTGTYTEYVNNVLKPAYEVLHANGEIVVGAAPGVFTDAAQYLKDAGYLNYVDFANYHPYGNDANEQIARINEVKRIFAGKPLTLTEWNLMPYTATQEKWANELKKVRTFIVQNVDSAFYYHLTFTADWASTGGLFRPDAGGYVPNPIFYDMYKGWNIQRAA